mmetsp:Transcript_15334/g.27346  ORF Transcript_15334/g.27346 Transcript_15334/m.27346 type:complete len:212 (+) Transcript_15334:266-901(+)
MGCRPLRWAQLTAGDCSVNPRRHFYRSQTRAQWALWRWLPCPSRAVESHACAKLPPYRPHPESSGTQLPFPSPQVLLRICAPMTVSRAAACRADALLMPSVSPELWRAAVSWLWRQLFFHYIATSPGHFCDPNAGASCAFWQVERPPDSACQGLLQSLLEPAFRRTARNIHGSTVRHTGNRTWHCLCWMCCHMPRTPFEWLYSFHLGHIRR